MPTEVKGECDPPTIVGRDPEFSTIACWATGYERP